MVRKGYDWHEYRLSGHVPSSHQVTILSPSYTSKLKPHTEPIPNKYFTPTTTGKLRIVTPQITTLNHPHKQRRPAMYGRMPRPNPQSNRPAGPANIKCPNSVNTLR